MWELPSQLMITSGQGQARYKLNSFDMALLDAKIANFNHSIQSSIIPPGCRIYTEPITLPLEGSILPTIMSRKHGTEGETICAGLAFGINKDPLLPGLVYELTGTDLPRTVSLLKEMIQDAAWRRSWTLQDVMVKTCSFTVKQPHGCALVAAVLLP